MAAMEGLTFTCQKVLLQDQEVLIKGLNLQINTNYLNRNIHFRSHFSHPGSEQKEGDLKPCSKPQEESTKTF